MPSIPKYSVSDLTQLIKATIEENFYNLEVEGEISNCRPSSTGHLYFSLKDADAMVSAVMFRGRRNSLKFQPADGQKVIVRGNLSVYAKRGSYQIIVETMKKAGEGDILAMLEERKRLLAAEGLFDSDRKQAIPRFPGKIAIVTSPTGAALKDILRVLKRRSPGTDIMILPTAVQGETAGMSIADQILRADSLQSGDLLIVTRGGGSLEDLLPFSDEAVVRAVAACSIPVISAIGHEIDWALCDFAADRRAPTPSAAAEVACESTAETQMKIRRHEESMTWAVRQRCRNVQLLLGQFSPENLRTGFQGLLQPVLLRLDDAKEGLLDAMREKTGDLRHRLSLLRTGLESVSPTAVLARGYALITSAESGKLVRSAADVGPGDEIDVKLAEGELTANVSGRTLPEELK